jgi:hypothetical protein
MVEADLTNRGDLFLVGEVIFKDKVKTTSRLRWGKNSIIKWNGRGCDFGALLECQSGEIQFWTDLQLDDWMRVSHEQART